VGGREVAWGFVRVPPVEIAVTVESQAGKDEIEKGERRRRRSCGVVYVNWERRGSVKKCFLSWPRTSSVSSFCDCTF
jgi:hypothetical protein